jgi:hypothetical protein
MKTTAWKSVVTIKEIETQHGNIYIKTVWQLFRISPARAGGGFEMFEAGYHSHRQGKPLKRKVQIPRWKLVARLISLPVLHEGGRVPLIKDDGTFEKRIVTP